jgi:hypothetical protein
MATRLISFRQLVLEADPDWQRGASKPMAYEFSNGRLFYREPNPYPVLVESATIGAVPPMTAGQAAAVPYTAQYVEGGTIELWTVVGSPAVWDSFNWDDGSVWQ